MGIFKRIRDVSLAALNDMLDKAEDPVSMMNQYLRDMEADLAEAEIAVAKQIAVEKKLQHQWEEASEQADKRGQQALQALQAEQEDLARRALQDKKALLQKVDDFKAQFEKAKAAADVLRGQLQEMRQQLEEMKQRKASLVARVQAAKAQKQMHQNLSGLGNNSGVKGFERMQDKVMQIEAEALASKELVQRNRSLDQELDALGDPEIEEELEALKLKLKQGE